MVVCGASPFFIYFCYITNKKKVYLLRVNNMFFMQVAKHLHFFCNLIS